MRKMKGKLANLFYWIGEIFYNLGDWVAPILHNVTDKQNQEANNYLKNL